MRTAEQADFIDRLRGYAQECGEGVPIKRRRVIWRELWEDWRSGLHDDDTQISVDMILTLPTSKHRRERLERLFTVMADRYEARWPIEGEKPMPVLLWPVENGAEAYNAENPFGANPELYAPIGYPGHHGCDFTVNEGTPVLAAAGGYVESCGDLGSAGNHVKLFHPELGKSTRYIHLSQWCVEVAQWVEAGDVIGLSGNTGYSLGPHLHFDVWDDAEPSGNGYGGRVDPYPLLVGE